MNQIITEETIPVMWDDGYDSAHSLAVSVLNKAEIISNIFDVITEKKGVAIMKMIESVFGASQVLDGFKVFS